MLSTVPSATVVGVHGLGVRVEVHVGDGLPGFAMIGLPDTSCREARDRVRAALLSCGLQWPNRKITVNLSPSNVRKVGASLDLAIAVAVLVASDQLDAAAAEGIGFIGELGLDGAVRATDGVLPMVAGIDAGRVVVGAADAADARIGAGGRAVLAARHLGEAVAALRGEAPWSEVPHPPTGEEPPWPYDLAEVHGQPFARRAVEVAAAGGHHLLLIGPPGAGKTMLAERLPTVLPPLDDRTALEASCIRSVVGERSGAATLLRRPPFRAPHHTASLVSMTGGGTGALRPGEITRAHGGVLFLDELGEFPPAVLDALRQPLEERVIRVSRAAASTTFPASFLLVAATNPCPCGFAPSLRCTCGPAAIARYRRRLSGPLLDRFDLRLVVSAPRHRELVTATAEESSADVAVRVADARRRALARGVTANAELSAASLRDCTSVTEPAAALLSRAAGAGQLSGRGMRRVRCVALTLDDLRGGDGCLDEEVVSGALALRGELATRADAMAAS